MSIREQAIRICAIAASQPWPMQDSDRIVLEQELSVDAGYLADEAVSHVMMSCVRDGNLDERWRADWAEAEAECLLREGWQP